MGVIRGGALAIISVFLFVGFIAGALLFTISWSLNYENVQPEIREVVVNTFDREIGLKNTLTEGFPATQASCQSSSDYIFKYQGSDVIIPCNVVDQGQDAVVAYGIDKFIEVVYFTNYDCGFWDCFGKYEIPFFLVSAKSQSYFYSLFNYVLIAIGILAVLGFLFAERKSNFFLLVSVLLVIASLPFAKFDLIIGFFGETAEDLLQIFFNKAFAVFTYMAMIGAGLFVLGWILKLFRVGFKLSTIFAKKEEVSKDEVKKIVKEEVKKVEKEEKKKQPPKKEEKKLDKTAKKKKAK